MEMNFVASVSLLGRGIAAWAELAQRWAPGGSQKHSWGLFPLKPVMLTGVYVFCINPQVPSELCPQGRQLLSFVTMPTATFQLISPFPLPAAVAVPQNMEEGEIDVTTALQPSLNIDQAPDARRSKLVASGNR